MALFVTYEFSTLPFRTCFHHHQAPKWKFARNWTRALLRLGVKKVVKKSVKIGFFKKNGQKKFLTLSVTVVFSKTMNGPFQSFFRPSRQKISFFQLSLPKPLKNSKNWKMTQNFWIDFFIFSKNRKIRGFYPPTRPKSFFGRRKFLKTVFCRKTFFWTPFFWQKSQKMNF